MTVVYPSRCYATRRGKHIVAALSVREPCPTNNFKTTVAIEIKLGKYIDGNEGKCCAQEP